MGQALNILVVDDDPFNRDLLDNYLQGAGYKVVQAHDGEHAWEILNRDEEVFVAILLDRMMPRLDGMGLLMRIKNDQRFTYIPVIFQTSVEDVDSIAEGIRAGAFYYLVKPCNKDMVLAIVHSAVDLYDSVKSSQKTVSDETRQFYRLMQSAQFSFQTLAEACFLAARLAEAHPDPQRSLLGLSELMINAVEHGNLEIGYGEKSNLLKQCRWEEEMARRVQLPCYADRQIMVAYQRHADAIRVTITDQGKGFDWEQYLTLSPERAFDPHGRGIAMSKLVSFDVLEYHGRGNQVTVTTWL